MNKYTLLLSTFFLFSCNDKSADEYLTEAKLTIKEQAITTYQQYVAAYPEEQIMSFALARRLMDNQHSEALKHLYRAVDITKDHPPEPIYLNYIEAPIADQQKLLAKRRFEAFNVSKTNKAALAKFKAKLEQ